MKKGKKLLALIVGVVMTVSLAITVAACKSGSNYEVGIFIYKYADTYITSVRNSIEAEYQAKIGDKKIKFEFFDANENQATQNTQIDTKITKGVDQLIVNIVDESSGEAVVTKAKDEKLPVIFFNREVSDEVIKSYDQAYFVGTNAPEAGVLQGQLIFNLLSADWDATAKKFKNIDLDNDGKINYVMLRASTSNAEANGRTTESVKKANELLVAAGMEKLVQIGADTDCGWDAGKATTAMDTFLTSNPMSGSAAKIELVIANNDDMALGAIASLKKAGYNRGISDAPANENPKILVVGVDATATAQTAMTNKEMSGSVKQDNVTMAKAIVQMSLNIEAGNKGVDAIKDVKNASGAAISFDSGVNKLRIPYQIFTL